MPPRSSVLPGTLKTKSAMMETKTTTKQIPKVLREIDKLPCDLGAWW